MAARKNSRRMELEAAGNGGTRVGRSKTPNHRVTESLRTGNQGRQNEMMGFYTIRSWTIITVEVTVDNMPKKPVDFMLFGITLRVDLDSFNFLGFLSVLS